MKILDIQVGDKQNDKIYVSQFKILFECLTSYFEEKDISIPKYIQPYKAFMCAYKFSDLRALYDTDSYTDEIKRIVINFEQTTKDNKTKFYYVNKLGTQPSIAVINLDEYVHVSQDVNI